MEIWLISIKWGCSLRNEYDSMRAWRNVGAVEIWEVAGVSV
jgi:hypothetical protein